MNGEFFPNVPALEVKQGDWVNVTIKNESNADHPMHLHGHFFRVLKRNGQAVSTEICKDTILLKQDESVEVAFPADNPGDWLFHCHDLHHASSGMVGTVNYEGYEPPKDIQMTDEDKPE
ncbi:multicopper oxidase domain-containing protein [Ammoniphilus sp. 3BR4]|uniref:multicopper oxidase domain-containing protein n=1 Tax=Ammoniphilus sp. 3BR4 TaxID=3158265 RepID=UPI0034662B7E